MLDIIGSVCYFGGMVVPFFTLFITLKLFNELPIFEKTIVVSSFTISSTFLLLGVSMSILFGSGPVAVGATQYTGWELFESISSLLVFTFVVTLLLALPALIVIKLRRTTIDKKNA